MEPKNHRKTNARPEKFTKRKTDSEMKRKMANTKPKNSPASRLKSNYLNTFSEGEESRNSRALPFKSALRQYHEAKQEKIRSKKQLEKRLKEARMARQKYDQKKLYRNRKLLAKTSKGQPIMKNRVEILLEQIRSSMVHK